MKKLWIASLFAGLLFCITYTGALAQSDEGTVPFCGRLDAEECAALDATSVRMAALTSGTSENVVKVYLTGGALGEREVSLQLSTTSTFVMEPETVARFLELKTMSPEALQTDAAAAADLLNLPITIDAEQTTTVAFSPDLLAMLGERFGANLPATLAFHSRIVDSVLYIRMADYKVFGPQPAWMPEWVGIQLTAIVSSTTAGALADPAFDVQEAQLDLETPGMGMASSVVYHVPAEQLAAYADFMTLTSPGLTQLDGQSVKSYRLTWDIPRYLGGPLFAEQVGLPAQSHPNPTSLALGMVASVLLHGLEADLVQMVGVGDGYLHKVETRVEWQLAVAGGAPLANRTTFGITSTTTNRDLNRIDAIAAPERAFVPPLNLLIQTFRFLNR